MRDMKQTLAVGSVKNVEKNQNTKKMKPLPVGHLAASDGRLSLTQSKEAHESKSVFLLVAVLLVFHATPDGTLHS